VGRGCSRRAAQTLTDIPTPSDVFCGTQPISAADEKPQRTAQLISNGDQPYHPYPKGAGQDKATTLI
jgi:hypothetical protein